MKKKKVAPQSKIPLYLLSILVGIVTFLIFFLTLSHYGTNWDEPQHFSRGQAYLHYFLTGEKDFNSIPKYPPFKGTSEFGKFRNAENDLAYRQKHPEITNKNYRRSVYQYDSWSAEYYFTSDSGHPPLNGILASLTNYIFYHKLGIIDDVDSYHLFEILSGALLVGIVFYFSVRYFGLFAGFIATLSLVLYPLFLGEVHFNIKDPPLATFYAATIIFFFMGVVHTKWKYIIISSIFCGLALGTKFNILFVPVILLLWVGIYWFQAYNKKFGVFFHEQRSVLLAFLAYPFIVFIIFFGTWPYLWQDPVRNFLTIFGYYKTIGTGVAYQPAQYFWHGFNMYPLLWIIYTTPPITLFLSLIGLIACLLKIKKDPKYIGLLILLWFILPIWRVTMPGSSIYGGVRQIMEYIPAMAILAGIGAMAIVRVIKVKKIVVLLQIGILLAYGLFAMQMIRQHPNENLYFNAFVGGLSGAENKNIPAWGNSYGNVYYQGVTWLNTHVEENAKLALISGTMINVPRTKLRPDIVFSNNTWSGVDRKGEYMMDMVYEGFPIKTYAYEYLQRYLKPVYELKVDGVTVLAIWKNDEKHTNPGFVKEDTNVKVVDTKIQDDMMVVTLDKPVYLTKIDMKHGNNNCEQVKDGFIQISKDGQLWERQGENIPVLQVTMDIEPKDKRFVYLFAAKPAKYLRIYTNSKKSCLFDYQDIIVTKLTDKNL